LKFGWLLTHNGIWLKGHGDWNSESSLCSTRQAVYPCFRAASVKQEVPFSNLHKGAMGRSSSPASRRTIPLGSLLGKNNSADLGFTAGDMWKLLRL
jgi:hypothetical protein